MAVQLMWRLYSLEYAVFLVVGYVNWERLPIVWVRVAVVVTCVPNLAGQGREESEESYDQEIEE